MQVTILSQTKSMATIRIEIEGAPLTVALNDEYKIYTDKKPENPVARENVAAADETRELFHTAVQNVLTDYYPEAIKQTGLTVASMPEVRVRRADEQDGLEFELEFALRPELKLGQYKGIRVKKPDTTLTEEEYQKALAAAEKQNLVMVDVDRPAQLGDTATIDFKGYLDDVPFEGGTGEGYPLKLGSGTFIPGFEEQLVGASVGDEPEVHVTFPENYQAANLAGKPTIFRCKVHKIQVQELQPLTDAQKETVRKNAAQQKISLADQQIEDEVLEKIITEADVEIPDAMIRSEVSICMDQFASELQSKGMDINTFSQQSGKSIQQMAEEMRPLAKRRIMLRLVLNAIAEAEHLEATEEEIDARWDAMAKNYGMTAQQLKSYAGEGADEQIRTEITGNKAYMLLRESTILI